MRYEADGFDIVKIDDDGNSSLFASCKSCEEAKSEADRLNNEWPCIDDAVDDDSHLVDWYEDDREYRFERMQDRIQEIYCAFMSSPELRRCNDQDLVKTAVEIIRMIDKAAQREVDRDG